MLLYRELVSGVRKTTDGGKSWTDFIPVSLDEFFSRKILFITPETGFIYNDDMGYGIEGYKTTDGGFTWSDNEFARVEYLSFIDTAVGFGAGYTEQLDRIFIKTTDQGSSFTYIYSNGFIGSNIFFINDLIGWRIGYDNSTAFQVTYDGGLTWETETENVLSMLWSGVGWNLHGKTLFAGGDQLILYRRSPTAVDVKETDYPLEYTLSQNYPNPFNPVTTIKYTVPHKSFITIKIFNVLGKEITTLVNDEKSPGVYELTWNAGNLPSGVYFYRLQNGSFIDTRKMILMK
jgi:hypothetical protein